jgi:hypothetical protein
MSIAVKSSRWWQTNQISYKLDDSITLADTQIIANNIAVSVAGVHTRHHA